RGARSSRQARSASNAESAQATLFALPQPVAHAATTMATASRGPLRVEGGRTADEGNRDGPAAPRPPQLDGCVVPRERELVQPHARRRDHDLRGAPAEL